MRNYRRGLIGRVGVILAVLALVAAACGGDDGTWDTVAVAMDTASSASANAGVALSDAQSAGAAAAAAQAAADAAQAAAELAQATATGNQAAVREAEAALADAQAAADAARSQAAAAQEEADAARQAAEQAAEAASMADEPAAESITLEFWSWNNEGAYPVVHEEAEAHFEADFPNVDVVRTYTPFADYMTNLRAAIAAGQPPDVAQVPWTGEYTDLVNSGQIMSLEGEFTDGFPGFFAPIAAIASVDGEPFAIPLDVNSLQIAYNKDIFAELGLEVPRSSDALKAVAAALDDARAAARGSRRRRLLRRGRGDE